MVPPPVIVTVPCDPLVSAVIVNVSPLSGRIVSLASTLITVPLEFFGTILPTSFAAIGGSSTAVTVIVKV